MDRREIEKGGGGFVKRSEGKKWSNSHVRAAGESLHVSGVLKYSGCWILLRAPNSTQYSLMRGVSKGTHPFP